MFRRFNWYNKFGSIPSEFREAMSYEEQILWLCQQINDLKSESGNFNYNLLVNKPKINGTTLEGNISLNTLGIQEKLIPGSGITISGNVISATGGGGGGETFPVRVLQQNLILEDYQIPSLEEGLYFQPSGINVYYDSVTFGKELFNNSDILFWDSENRILSNGTNYAKYSSIDNKWQFFRNQPKTNLTSDLYLMPDGTIKDSNFDNVDLLNTNYFTSSHKVYESLGVSESKELIGNFEVFYFTLAISGQPELITNKLHIYYADGSWKQYGINTPFELDEDIVLLANTPLELPSGFYRFSDSQKGLYYHEALAPNLIHGYNDGLFYFDFDTQTINLDLKSYFYDSDESNDWLIAEHTNITNEIVNLRNKIPTSQAVYQALQNISPTASAVKTLTSDVVLQANTQLTLESALYYTGIYKVYLHSATSENVLIGNNEIIYVANGSNIVSDNYNISLVDDGNAVDWQFDKHSGITDEIINDSTLIPTSKAVYLALQNIQPSGGIFTNLTNYLYLTDGNNITLEDGWYYANNYGIYLNGTYIPQTNKAFFKVFKIENDDSYIDIYTGATSEIKHTLTYFHSSDEWYEDNIKKSNIIKNETGTSSQLRTSIPSSGNNNDVANINAIRNYVAKEYAIFKINTTRNYSITQTGSVNGVNLIVDSLISQLGDNFELTNNHDILVKKNMTLEINGFINPYDYDTTGTGLDNTIGIVFYYTRNNTRNKIDGASIFANVPLAYIPFYCITDLQAGDILQPGMFSGKTRPQVTLGSATFNLKIISYN